MIIGQTIFQCLLHKTQLQTCCYRWVRCHIYQQAKQLNLLRTCSGFKNKMTRSITWLERTRSYGNKSRSFDSLKRYLHSHKQQPPHRKAASWKQPTFQGVLVHSERERRNDPLIWFVASLVGEGKRKGWWPFRCFMFLHTTWNENRRPGCLM